MTTRRLQSPGIEINELDRSQYNKVDYSLPNSPTCMIVGFASRGEDLALKWINSDATLKSTYGQPTTEFEAYFYNAAKEVLNRGGTCIAAKLPYVNDSYERYNYVQYKIGNLKTHASIKLDIEEAYATIGEIHDTLQEVLVQLSEADDISTIMKMSNTIKRLYNKYKDTDVDIDTINALKERLSDFISTYSHESEYAMLFMNDTNLTSYFDITFDHARMSELSEFDSYLTNERSVTTNSLRIYDITREVYQQYNTVDHIVESTIAIDETGEKKTLYNNDFLGIVPVIVSPLNAMFFQNVLDHPQDESTTLEDYYKKFNQVGSFKTTQHSSVDATKLSDIDQYSVIPLQSMPFDEYDTTTYTNESLSRSAALQFPQIIFNGPSHFEDTYLKQIGIVVFKAFKDMDNNGKVNYQLVESFVGSLDKKAKDGLTNKSIFIDDVVNNNSNYIKMFSNADQYTVEKASTIVMSNQAVASLGFYKIQTKKRIEYNQSILKPLTYILDNAANVNAVPLDLLIDAGISNIAYLANKKGAIDTDDKPKFSDYSIDPISTKSDIVGWERILNKFDNFCKNMRKDCMFLADGLRMFCLDGNQKYVRKTAPQNTVANSIIPKLKFMTNVLNSSYSAGYCNWFYQLDYSSAYEYIWIPPSIKAAGVYIHCDVYAHPWSAPAGVNRGKIQDAIDVAFLPLEADSGKIYSNEWNYAMSYPLDGIVIEGHKTFQMQHTALDRVNVRRLLLWLEKQVVAVSRKFVYEGNTEYLRQLFIDTIRPIFENAVSGEGLREYGIKCDDELNTTQVIENNELRCKIAVKPVKVVDWIVIDLISTRQSASISEELVK